MALRSGVWGWSCQEGLQRRVNNKNYIYVSIRFSTAANWGHLIGNSTPQNRREPQVSLDLSVESKIILLTRHNKSHQCQTIIFVPKREQHVLVSLSYRCVLFGSFLPRINNHSGGLEEKLKHVFLKAGVDTVAQNWLILEVKHKAYRKKRIKYSFKYLQPRLETDIRPQVAQQLFVFRATFLFRAISSFLDIGAAFSALIGHASIFYNVSVDNL